MSNLEHIFESALVAIEKGLKHYEWLAMMYRSNCNGNASSVDIGFRGKSPNAGVFASLNDGRYVWLSDIWELAQYTYPLIVMAKDLKEDE